MIDDSDNDPKHHWKSDDILMTLWLCLLMMLPLGAHNVRSMQALLSSRTHNAQEGVLGVGVIIVE